MANEINCINFPITIDYSKSDIKRVQEELLKMANIICNILESSNILYMISYGTLLGAVRHQDFIPWDDDFDLFVFDDDYEEAILILEKELPDHLLVHSIKNDPLYFKAWNSIKNINTVVINEQTYHVDNQLLRYNCLTVDLFRLKKISSELKRKYQLDEALFFFNRKKKLNIIKEEVYLEKVSEIKNELLNIKVNNTDADSFFSILGMQEPISIEDTFPLRKYKFSNYEFLGPRNYDIYLKSFYGNYNQLPDFNDRRKHYKKVVFIESNILPLF